MSDKPPFVSPIQPYDMEILAEKNCKFLIQAYLKTQNIADISVRIADDLRDAQVLRSKRIVISCDFEDSQVTTRVSYGIAKMRIQCITAKALDPDGDVIGSIVGNVRSAFIGQFPEETLSRNGIRVYPNSMRLRGTNRTNEVEEENQRIFNVDIPMYKE